MPTYIHTYIHIQPTAAAAPSSFRRFGTVLSVNSPATTVQSSAKKSKSRLHHSTLTTAATAHHQHHHRSIPEETILFEPYETVGTTTSNDGSSNNALENNTTTSNNNNRKYTVTFEAGPIGLQLDPVTCRVIAIVGGADSPARRTTTTTTVAATSPDGRTQRIQEGDAVVAVNGVPIVAGSEKAMALLKDTRRRRSITFASSSALVAQPDPSDRNPPQHSPPRSEENTSNTPLQEMRRKHADKMQTNQPSTTTTTTTTGLPGRIQKTRSLQKSSPSSVSVQKRISFASPPSQQHTPTSSNSNSNSTAAASGKRSVSKRISTSPSNHSTTTNIHQNMDVSIPATAKANGELEQTRRELKTATNMLMQFQAKIDALEQENNSLRQPNRQFNAIKEMELKMRIHSLETESTSLRESKTKLKARLNSSDQRLANDQNALIQYNQELRQAIAKQKESSTALEQTRTEFSVAKKEWSDERAASKRANDKLTVALEQNECALDRAHAAQLQSDARIQQLESIRLERDEEVGQLRSELQKFESNASLKTEQLLDSLRKKDGQLELLRLEMVSIQSENASLQDLVSAAEVSARQASADWKALSNEKVSVQNDLVGVSSSLKAALEEKDRTQSQLSKLEDRLLERERTIDSLTESSKALEKDLQNQLSERNEAMIKSAESIDSLYQEKENLVQKIAELRIAHQSFLDRNGKLSADLEATQVQLSATNKSSALEKCDLLKRVEELEGEVIRCHGEIQQSDNRLTNALNDCKLANARIGDLSRELAENQDSLADVRNQLECAKTTMESLKASASAKELELRSEIDSIKRNLNESLETNETVILQNLQWQRQGERYLKASRSAVTTELTLRAAIQSESLAFAEYRKQKKQKEEELSLEIQNLQTRLEMSAQAACDAKTELATAVARIASANREIERLSTGIAQANSALLSSAHDFQCRKEQFLLAETVFVTREQEFATSTSQMTREIAELSRSITVLESGKNAISAQVCELDAAKTLSESTNVELGNELAKSKGRNFELTLRIDELETLLEESRKLVDTHKQECSTTLLNLAFVEATVNNLTLELSEAETKVAAFELESRELRANVETLQETEFSLSTALKNEEIKKSLLVAQLDELHEQLKTTASEWHDSKENNNELRFQLRRADTDLQKSRDLIEDIQIDVNTLKEALSESEKLSCDANTTAIEQCTTIQSLRDANLTYKRDLDQVIDEKALWVKQLDEMSARTAAKEKDFYQSQEDVNELRLQLCRSNEDLRVIYETNDHLTKDVDRLTFELSALGDRLAETAIVTAELESEVDVLKGKEEALKMSLEKERNDNDSSATQINSLLKRINGLTEAFQTLQVDSADQRLEHIQSEAYSSNLQHEIGRLTLSLSAATEQALSTETTTNKLVSINELLKKAEVFVMESLKKALKENNTLAVTVDDLKLTAISMAEALEKSTRDAAELGLQLCETEADFQRSEALNDEIKREIIPLQSTILFLQKRNEELVEAQQQSESDLQSLSRVSQHRNSDADRLIISLQAKHSLLEDKLTSTNDELKKSLDEVACLSGENNSLFQKSVSFEDIVADLKNAKFQLSEELTKCTTELKCATDNAQITEIVLTQKVDTLNLELNDIQLRLKSSDIKLKETTNQLLSDSSENDRLASLNKQLQQDLQSVRSEASALKNKLEATEIREKTSRTEMDDVLQRKLLAASANLDARLSDFRIEVAAKDAKIRSLELSESSTKKDFEKMKDVNSRLSSEIDLLRLAVSDKEDELCLLRGTCSESSNQLDVVDAELESKLDIVTKTSDALTHSKTQISELDLLYRTLFEDFGKFREESTLELGGVKAENVALQAENSNLDALVRSIGKEEANMQALLVHVQDELNTQKAVFLEQGTASSATQKRLETKVKTLSEESQKYRDLSTELNNECNALRDDIDQLQTSFDVLTKQSKETDSYFAAQKQKFNMLIGNLSKDLAEEKAKVASSQEESNTLRRNAETSTRDLLFEERRLQEQIRLLVFEADLVSKRQTTWRTEHDNEMTSFRKCRDELCLARQECIKFEESLKQAQENAEQQALSSRNMSSEYVERIELQAQVHAGEFRCLQKERDELKDALFVAKAERHSIETRLTSVEKVAEDRRLVVETLSTDNANLSSAFQEAKKTLSEIKCIEESNQNLSLDSDSTASPFKSLRKRDIASRCVELQNETSSALNDLLMANQEISRRSEYVISLGKDLECMSNEMNNLVTANCMLERRLTEMMSQMELTEQTTIESQKTASALKSELFIVSQRLTASSAENAVIADYLRTSKEETLSVCSELEALRLTRKIDKEKYAKENVRLEKEKCDVEEKLSQLHQELISLQNNLDASEQIVKNVESRLTEMTSKYNTSTFELSTAQTDAQQKQLRFENDISVLETERISLRSSLTDLEHQIQSQNSVVDAMTNNERVLLSKVDRLQQKIQDAEKCQDEIDVKRSEESKVLKLQQEKVTEFAHRAKNAELLTFALSETVKTYETSMSTLTAVDKEYLEKIRVLEVKKVILEEERAKMEKSAESLREDLRCSQREASELLRSKTATATRFEAMRQSMEGLKYQLNEARVTKEESKNSVRTLEAELDNKKIEVEHFKATIQVLTATSARLQANNLLQESSHRKENKCSDGLLNKEISNLQTELESKTLKLESISEVYRSQQQVLSLSQALEGQLIRFIEDIVTQTDQFIGKFASRSEKLHEHIDRLSLESSLEALDLAGFEKRRHSLSFFRTGLDSLTLLIPHAISHLEDRREQLRIWKSQRSERVPHKASTPKKCAPATGIPDTPAIREAFQRMKNVLNDEILSPSKIRTTSSELLDVESLKNVIHTLEAQIDVLLLDLQAANEALHTKDTLFSDLESLVTQHEVNNKRLKQKTIKLDNELQKEIAKRESAEHESTELLNQLSRRQEIVPSHTDPTANKLAARRLIVRALSSRENAAKAVAFRRWACHTSASCAVAKQGHAAVALTRQLEETREKLVILKRHLKKTRRGPRDFGGLDRIAEHKNEG